ncbi:MAG: hypothetical protein ABSD98_18380, partial [Candidatus Korobacteraceae bacterium]
TTRIRGNGDPAAIAAEAMSAVRQPHDHRSWAASQTSARPAARLDLDSPRPMRTLPKNVYSPASMVAALWPLQLSMPARSI